jgi:hypothetical protein
LFTAPKARHYVLAITLVANLVVAGFSPRSVDYLSRTEFMML